MNNQAAGNATKDIIGTLVRDNRRDPLNHMSASMGAWETKRLGDIADIDPENLPNNTNPDYEFSYISIEQVEAGRLLGFTETIFRKAPSRARRVLRENDILMSTVRPNLMAHLFFRMQIPNAICSTGFAVIRSKFNLSDPGFLFAHLFGHVVNKQIDKILSGSNYPAISTADVRRIKIPCPPNVEEQCAIAEALSDVDSLIQSMEALIAKKRVFKQAAMQQLLTGKTRLAGFSGAWETRRLGEVTSIRKGQLITESSAKPGTVPVIAGGKKPAYFHNSANRTGKTITVSASGAYAGYVAYWDEPIFASDCSTISEAPNYSIQYIFYQMLLAQKKIYHAQTGGAQPHVHGRDLDPLIISIPPIRGQHAIAAILSDMDAEIDALERRRDKAHALKQGVMQQLLTGRIRLPKTV